jgi:CRP-like cAMP-binding protein/uncharacterized protein HemY
MDLHQAVTGIVRLLKQREVERAAAIYSRLQDAVGYELVNLKGNDPGFFSLLAHMFFLAKDYEKAGIIFERLSAYDKAAILYEKADLYDLAGEMYTKAEKWEQAARMFEKHGNYAQAAELFTRIGDLPRAAINYERAVNHFLAGKMYYQLNKEEKALELLQKIGPEDPSYLPAQEMIARLLRRSGYRPLGIRRLKKIVEQKEIQEETLDLVLLLGEFLAEEGEFSEAKQWLHALLEFRFPYKHAADLLRLVEAGKRPEVAGADKVSSEELEEILIVEETEPPPTPEKETALIPMPEEFATLKEAPLFRELNLKELKQFWELAQGIEWAKGTTIIEQGVPGKGLYILAEGKVEVQRVSPQGNTETLAVLEKGAHLGEMSLLDNTPTSARVVALTATRGFWIPKEAFLAILEEDDRIAAKIYRAFAQTLMDRLRQTNEQFVSFKEKEKKLAEVLGLK